MKGDHFFSWGPTTVFRLVFGKHSGKCYDKMIKQSILHMDTKIHMVLHSYYVKRLSRRQKKQESLSDSAVIIQRVRSKQGLRISKGNSDFNTLSSPWGLTPVINNTTIVVGSVILPSHGVDLAWWVSLPWWVCFPRKINGSKALSPFGAKPPQFSSF